MPKKKQQKPAEKNGKSKGGVKRKSLPRRPGGDKQGMFLSKLDTVEFLVKKYGLSNIDAMIAFDSFFKKYPSGEITKEQFLEEYKDNIMDGGGTIDDDEVYGVVVALFKMLNRETEDEKVDDIVDDILEKVDANGDGVISQQEFVHHAMKSSFLAELIENHTNTKPSK